MSFKLLLMFMLVIWGLYFAGYAVGQDDCRNKKSIFNINGCNEELNKGLALQGDTDDRY